ncbi:MAG: hypothetical protein PVH77_05455 [Phycisphaerales bacterium]
MRTKKMITTFLGAILFISNSPLLAQDAYIAQFGVTEGKSVDKGVVFIDGQYIESPYIVSRKGLAIYINGKQIPNPTRHSGKQPPIIKRNPELMTEDERYRTVQNLEATIRIYERKLNDGYSYLFSSEGGHITLDPYTSAYDLPVIIKVITSNLTLTEKIAELDFCNWHLFIDVRRFIINFNASSQLSSRLENMAQDLLKTDEFGIGNTETVDQGYLFVDGSYINAPYAIQRKGLGVFINGNMIERPHKWPVYVPSGDTDPKLPEGINENTSINDDIISQYLIEKQTFLHKHEPEKEAEIMAQVIENLPFVTQSQLDKDNPSIIHFTTTEGHTISQSLISRDGRTPKMDKNSILNRVENKRSHYQKGLGRGSCFFVFHDGKRIRLSQKSIKEKLPSLVEILQSSDSSRVKKQKINKINLPFTSKSIDVLISNYKTNTKLEKRLNLRQEIKRQ